MMSASTLVRAAGVAALILGSAVLGALVLQTLRPAPLMDAETCILDTLKGGGHGDAATAAILVACRELYPEPPPRLDCHRLTGDQLGQLGYGGHFADDEHGTLMMKLHNGTPHVVGEVQVFVNYRNDTGKVRRVYKHQHEVAPAQTSTLEIRTLRFAGEEVDAWGIERVCAMDHPEGG